ncbi:hypothetical protein CAPTEDRAFT_192617 [Capitella teleta]|uniref:Uncharacterized protein n=1 Tax=Capitella teleta TaxID=283909 RepID=R7U1I6_CAPTE|nr:hypothetical protein CAPTEDRAFT_192617 [Capitella teleta]|eukprot:ELT97526.1 hypothetical protein CAPTEDRAFT_192617 [Capitella teleta]
MQKDLTNWVIDIDKIEETRWSHRTHCWYFPLPLFLAESTISKEAAAKPRPFGLIWNQFNCMMSEASEGGGETPKASGSKLDALPREALLKFVKKQTLMLQKTKAKCDGLGSILICLPLFQNL